MAEAMVIGQGHEEAGEVFGGSVFTGCTTELVLYGERATGVDQRKQL